MDVAETDRIINAVEAGWRVISVMVPTRAIRVVADDADLKFRVEQLDFAANFTWRVVSTHVGDEAFESFHPALKDAIGKQARLKEKLKLAQHEARMAAIKAQEIA